MMSKQLVTFADCHRNTSCSFHLLLIGQHGVTREQVLTHGGGWTFRDDQHKDLHSNAV